MKYLLTFLLINTLMLTSLAQDAVNESSAKISKVEIQGIENGKAHVKVWISSTDVESLDYVKMQFSGRIIPRMTVLATLKQSSSVLSSSGTNMILMEGDITVNTSSNTGNDSIRYQFKKSSPTNLRTIRAGSVVYFPPSEKQ